MKQVIIVGAMMLATSFAAEAHKTTPPPATPDHNQQQEQNQTNEQTQQTSVTTTAEGGQGGTATATGGTATGVGGNSSSVAGADSSSSSGGNIFSSVTNTEPSLPSAYAPAVYPTAPCIVSNSGGGTNRFFGLSLGISHKDDDCTRREDARTLQSLGETQGAVSLMCQKESIYKAMKARCDLAMAGTPPEPARVLIVEHVVAPPTPVPAVTPVIKKPVIRITKKRPSVKKCD